MDETWKLNYMKRVPDDATELVCPGCSSVIISVPKGKTKMALNAEVVSLRRDLERLKDAGLFTRIFMWREFFKRGV